MRHTWAFWCVAAATTIGSGRTSKAAASVEAPWQNGSVAIDARSLLCHAGAAQKMRQFQIAKIPAAVLLL
jgi:hypothetical protein